MMVYDGLVAAEPMADFGGDSQLRELLAWHRVPTC